MQLTLTSRRFHRNRHTRQRCISPFTSSVVACRMHLVCELSLHQMSWIGQCKNRCVAARASSGPDPFESLLKSKVLQNEMVVREFERIVSDMMSLSKLASRFPDFDLEGKRMFLDKFSEAGDRYEIFMKRLELSDDPHSKEYLRFTNAQMLNGGFTFQAMFQGLQQKIENFRSWVEQEEKVASDPIEHQKFLQMFRESWSSSFLGKVDMQFMYQLQAQNPQLVMKAQTDPQFWLAMKEIFEDPSELTVAKWREHPNLGPLVVEVWKSVQRTAASQQQRPDADR